MKALIMSIARSVCGLAEYPAVLGTREDLVVDLAAGRPVCSTKCSALREHVSSNSPC